MEKPTPAKAVTETRTYPVMGKRFVIEESRYDTPTVKILKLKPVDPFNIVFKPGQFINLYINKDGEKINARPYSISSSPADNNHFELTIAIAGYFTQAVDKLKVGDTVRVNGPFGRFVLDESVKELVLIAGGTGIAPFISMIRYIHKKKLPIKVTLFYSNRGPQYIMHKEELDKIQAENPNFKLVYTCTRESPPEWKGETGRINGEMMKRHLAMNGHTCMVCGPNEMVDAMVSSLKDLGAKEDKILIERWG